MTFRHRHLVAAVGLTLALVSCGAPPTAPPAGSGSDNGPSKFQQYEGLKGQERRDTTHQGRQGRRRSVAVHVDDE